MACSPLSPSVLSRCLIATAGHEQAFRAMCMSTDCVSRTNIWWIITVCQITTSRKRPLCTWSCKCMLSSVQLLLLPHLLLHDHSSSLSLSSSSSFLSISSTFPASFLLLLLLLLLHPHSFTLLLLPPHWKALQLVALCVLCLRSLSGAGRPGSGSCRPQLRVSAWWVCTCASSG